MQNNISFTMQVIFTCLSSKTWDYFVYVFIFQHAMQVVGIDEQTREDILSLVAGILHLGNLQFVENGNYAAIADAGCKFLISSQFTQMQYCCFLHIRLGFLPFSLVLENLIIHLGGGGIRWLSCFEWYHVIPLLWMKL